MLYTREREDDHPCTARAQPQRWNIVVVFFNVPFSMVDFNVSIYKDVHSEALMFV